MKTSLSQALDGMIDEAVVDPRFGCHIGHDIA